MKKLIVLFIFAQCLLVTAMFYFIGSTRYIFLFSLYLCCWLSYGATKNYFEYSKPYCWIFYGASATTDKNKRKTRFILDMFVCALIFPVLIIYGILN